MKKRLLFLTLLLLAGFAFFWCDLHWIIPGWWRGAAFYKGRPTANWRSEIQQWNTIIVADGPLRQRPDFLYWKQSSLIQQQFAYYLPELESRLFNWELPQVLAGDPKALPVLFELRDGRQEQLGDDFGRDSFRLLVEKGLDDIQTKNRGKAL